jgi:flagellar biosynthesis protein FlhF
MKVKTFRGPDAKAVMRQIKAELGPEAVILSTRTVREHGRRICETTAALEIMSQEAGDANGSGFAPAWRTWHQEWSRFKEQLLTILKPQIDLECLSPRQRLVLEYLEREGVGPEALLAVWEKFRSAPGVPTLKLLASLVLTRPLLSEEWPQRVHVLVGPNGVGKTSMALRLAIGSKRQGAGRICLANADTGQAKGRIFLRHYAELSGFDYRQLTTAQDWLNLKRDQHLFERIFIDMPGVGGNQSLVTWMHDGAQLRPCIHLCMSPHYRTEQIATFRKRYGSPYLSSIIWTKLDECCSFGALVDQGIFMNLPVSGLSHAPGLKNAWAPAGEEVLWKLILKHQLPYSSEDDHPKMGNR